MTNLEKMNEIVGTEATKEQVVKWAYMNRIHVFDLHHQKEFQSLESTVDRFYDTHEFTGDEFKDWEDFLDSDFVN